MKYIRSRVNSIDTNLLVRGASLVLLTVLTWLACKQDWLNNVTDNPGRVAALIVMIVAIAMVIRAYSRPSKTSITIVACICVAGYAFANKVLPQGSTVKFVGALLVFVIIAILNLYGHTPLVALRDRLRERRSQSRSDSDYDYDDEVNDEDEDADFEDEFEEEAAQASAT